MLVFGECEISSKNEALNKLKDARVLAEKALFIENEPMEAPKKEHILSEYFDELDEKKQHFLGYQTNQDVSFPKELDRFLKMNLLNIGDGFEEGTYKLNSKIFERAVIHYYARLWGLIDDKAEEDVGYWGYLTPMGSTEGNLCALWYAREYLLGHPVDEAGYKIDAGVDRKHRQPLAFFTGSSHYSLVKSCNMLQISQFSEVGPQLGECPINGGLWPKYVPSNADGSVHVESLAALVRFFVKHDYPIILCFNYGTTFSGAFDDVGEAINQLSDVLGSQCRQNRRYWIHVDGALAANYMPYIEKGMQQGEFPQQAFPSFDFNNEQVMSICSSPYKWIGSPWAFGVFLMRSDYQMDASVRPHYVGNRDATVAGSRNGLSAVFLWEALTRLGDSGLIAMAKHNETLAQYAYERLTELAQTSTFDQHSLLLQPRIPFSNMLLFRAPNADIMHRFTLCSDVHEIDGEQYSLSHLVMLGHVTQYSIDALMDQLFAPSAFDFDDDNQPPKDFTC